MKAKNLFILFFMILLFQNSSASDELNKKLLEEGRLIFYRSVLDKNYLNKAIDIFEKLQEDIQVAGKSQTYLGALLAIKGKHSFMPHNKAKWVYRGIKLMDQGIRNCPNDIEALFIYGTTNYYLPFFFGKKDDAKKSFKKIVELLPTQYQLYDTEIVNNAINFILEKIELTEEERNKLIEIRKKIKKQ